MFWWRKSKQQYKYAHASQKDGKGNQNQRDVEVVLAIHRIANEVQASRNQSYSNERKKSCREWLTISGLFAAALAAGIQCVLFTFSMKFQHDDTVAAIDATNLLAKSTEVISERVKAAYAARLTYDDPTLDLIETRGDGPVTGSSIQFTWRNVGQLATHASLIKANCWQHSMPEALNKGGFIQRDDTIPGNSLLRLQGCGLATHDLQNLIATGDVLFVANRAEYTDNFSTDLNVVQFCFKFFAMEGTVDRLFSKREPCEDGKYNCGQGRQPQCTGMNIIPNAFPD